MMRAIGRLPVFLLAIALAHPLDAAAQFTREVKIGDALRRNLVKAEVKAADETSATISLSKSFWTIGSLKVTIPAGTRLANRDSGGQSLITARAIVMYVGWGGPDEKKGTPVETYCANRFLNPPTLKSALVLSAGDGYGYTGGEETNPIRKLAECLSTSGADRESRQMAVWLAGDDKLGEKSYAEVQAALGRQLENKMRAQLEKTIMDQGMARLRQQFPSLPESLLREEAEKYRDKTLPAVLAAKVRQELNGYLTKGRPLLERCGYNTAKMRFFQTAARR